MTDEFELNGNCRARLEKAVAGAIRSSIHAHGSITPGLLGSVSKRVVGAIKDYNRYARETLQRKLRNKTVKHINSIYKRYTHYKAGSSSRGFFRNSVSAVVDFALELNAITEDEARQIYEWRLKWSIKPGIFEFGVKWCNVTPSSMRCMQEKERIRQYT